MAEYGYQFGDQQYEISVRAHPYTTGGTIFTASVYRVDGRELETISEDEMSASTEDGAVNRACDCLKKETGFDGAPYDLPEQKSPRVIRPR